MAYQLRSCASCTRYTLDWQLHRLGRMVQVPDDASQDMERQKLLPRMYLLHSIVDSRQHSLTIPD
jgi:hypothetical protein